MLCVLGPYPELALHSKRAPTKGSFTEFHVIQQYTFIVLRSVKRNKGSLQTMHPTMTRSWRFQIGWDFLETPHSVPIRTPGNPHTKPIHPYGPHYPQNPNPKPQAPHSQTLNPTPKSLNPIHPYITPINPLFVWGRIRPSASKTKALASEMPCMGRRICLRHTGSGALSYNLECLMGITWNV